MKKYFFKNFFSKNIYSYLFFTKNPYTPLALFFLKNFYELFKVSYCGFSIGFFGFLWTGCDSCNANRNSRNSRNKTETSAATTTTTTQATTAAAGVTYSDDVDYTSPGGEDTVRFTMTTDAEGVVTSLKATLEVGNDISKQLTAAFEEDAATKIVGKKLADLGDISAVGGASLTTNAFKQFVADRD